MVTLLVLVLGLFQGVISVLLFTHRKSLALFHWFYLPTFLLAWVGYLYYEVVYIARTCTGECNIRVDLLFIVPYLLFVTICTIAYYVVARRAAGAQRPEEPSGNDHP
jgi:hypothetical protein